MRGMRFHSPEFVLLATREAGYRNLMRLNSRAFLETPVHYSPHISWEWLRDESEGLIALTGGPEGPVALAFNADHSALAIARCDQLARFFGDRLYVELQRHGLDKERRVEGALIDLAYAKGLPLVATNEPYFATSDDYEAHDALLCIAGGRLVAETERDQLTPEHRFKTRAEMAVLFADIPEALSSTVEIAERCAFRPMTRKPILPHFTVAPTPLRRIGKTMKPPNCGGRLKRGLRSGWRCTASRRERRRRLYARLSFELDVITRMNYAGYFLIVADFIQYAKSEGIPVGPGPRLRRRLLGSLCAHYHRSRSDPVRPALRTFPQSRTRIDAGLRYRFLPGTARRSHRLRAEALRS